MISKNECFYLGRIIKKIGFKGCLSIKLEIDNPFFYLKKTFFFVEINNKLTPYHLQSIKHSNNNFFKIKFQEITSEQSAILLVGSRLMLPIEELEKLKKEEYILHELLGYTIIEMNNSKVGEVISVIEKTVLFSFNPKADHFFTDKLLTRDMMSWISTTEIINSEFLSIDSKACSTDITSILLYFSPSFFLSVSIKAVTGLSTLSLSHLPDKPKP